jgi:hypothetical protein
MDAVRLPTRIFLALQTSQAAWFRDRCPKFAVDAPAETEAGALSTVSAIDSKALLRSSKVRVLVRGISW